MATDQRTISMPLVVYSNDLEAEARKARHEAFRRFLVILEQAKKDPRDAVIMIVEDFEGDQPRIDKFIDTLGLRETAEKVYGC